MISCTSVSENELDMYIMFMVIRTWLEIFVLEIVDVNMFRVRVLKNYELLMARLVNSNWIL